MKKVIKLTESDLTRIVKRVINEDEDKHWKDLGFEDFESFFKEYEKADDYANKLMDEVDNILIKHVEKFLYNLDYGTLISEAQKRFNKKYPNFYDPEIRLENDYINELMDIDFKDIDYSNLKYDLVETLENYLYANHSRIYK